MDRRTFFKKAGAGGAAIALASQWNVFAESAKQFIQSSNNLSPPNIIVILADDLGWGDLSCYPSDMRYPDRAKIRTPNLDSLAAEGVRFTQGYSTAPVCTPSRAGLLMGRYQQRVGWYGFGELVAGIPKGELTMADVLRSKKYATACMGKWHLGFKPEQGPLVHGFDRFYGFLGSQHDYYDPTLGESVYGGPLDHEGNIFDQDKPVEKMEYLTDELTNQGIKFIDQQVGAKKPFFLYLPYNCVHTPLQAEWEKLKPWADEHADGKFNMRDIGRAMIESLDNNVGRILNRLMHLGIGRNTLVFFISDNGGQDTGDGTLVSLTGGLRSSKMFFWEGGIREPFIMRWPDRIPKGIVYNNPVSHLDVFATAASAAGFSKSPKQLDGTDLIPYIRGEKSGVPHDVLFWGYEKEGGQDGGRWAIRKGKWKLTCEYRDLKTVLYEKPPVIVTELHDLDADPTESVNLIDKYPDVVKELIALKEDFYGTCKPSILTPDLVKSIYSELDRRKKLDPNWFNENNVRTDGAPGHWLQKVRRLDP